MTMCAVRLLVPGQVPTAFEPRPAGALCSGDSAPDAALLTERFLAELPGLHAFVERMGVHKADGDDLIQEVFLVFHRRRADYDPMRPLAPWLRGIAYRLTLNHFKLRRDQPQQHNEELCRAVTVVSDPESRAAAGEALAIVRAALEALPVKLRAVFIMREIDGMEMRDVARALGIPRFTAYSRLRLARAKFSSVARQRMGAT